MNASQNQLTSRWSNEWEAAYKKIGEALQRKKSLAVVGLPTTSEGLTDIRGYSAPKEYLLYRTKSGIDQPYISETSRIKKQLFESFDFSFTDFEFCQFIDCRFSNCVFHAANLQLCNFWGCTFHDCRFQKTLFNEAKFQPSGILFPERKDNFKHSFFDQCNFTRASFQKQGLIQAQFARCKTNNMQFHQCKLQQAVFTGAVKNIGFHHCKLENVDFSHAQISGISLENQPIDQVVFPKGDSYFIFFDKEKQLSELDYRHFNAEELAVVDGIKTVWLHNKTKIDFVDINWLKKEDQETGRKLILLLANKGQS